MLRTLGGLGDALEQSGFTLVAPDGGKMMTRAEAEGFVDTISDAYEDKGMNAREWFSGGRFWDQGGHFDWLDPATDEESGTKVYRAFDASINSIEAATRDHDVRGILGFSQGCVFGSIVTALALRGELSFGDSLQFGIYLSGFLPSFDEPSVDLWPIQGEFGSLFIIGGRDPLFPEARETITPLAEKFPRRDREIVIVPGLGHDVPDDPDLTSRAAALARSCL